MGKDRATQSMDAGMLRWAVLGYYGKKNILSLDDLCIWQKSPNMAFSHITVPHTPNHIFDTAILFLFRCSSSLGTSTFPTSIYWGPCLISSKETQPCFTLIIVLSLPWRAVIQNTISIRKGLLMTGICVGFKVLVIKFKSNTSIAIIHNTQ